MSSKKNTTIENANAKKLVKKAYKKNFDSNLIKLSGISSAEGTSSSKGPQEALMMSRLRSTELTRGRKQWVFGLLRRNMKSLYEISNWGYNEHSKRAELDSPEAQYLVLSMEKSRTTRNSLDDLAFSHFRFVVENGRPVLYCYELQVEPEWQNHGLGSVLITELEKIAQAAKMECIMATVFAFNAPSLAFFHKNEFSADSSCPDGDDVDYLILSKKV